MTTGIPLYGVTLPADAQLPIVDYGAAIGAIPDLMGLWIPDADFLNVADGMVATINPEFGDTVLSKMGTFGAQVADDPLLNDKVLSFPSETNFSAYRTLIPDFYNWTIMQFLKPAATVSITDSWHFTVMSTAIDLNFSIRTTAGGGHFCATGNGMPAPQLGTAALDMNKYHCLAYTMATDTMRVYKDGVVAASETGTPIAGGGEAGITFFARDDAADGSGNVIRGFVGSCAGFALWPRALTDAEIATVAEAVKGMHPDAVEGAF